MFGLLENKLVFSFDTGQLLLDTLLLSHNVLHNTSPTLTFLQSLLRVFHVVDMKSNEKMTLPWLLEGQLLYDSNQEDSRSQSSVVSSRLAKPFDLHSQNHILQQRINQLQLKITKQAMEEAALLIYEYQQRQLKGLELQVAQIQKHNETLTKLLAGRRNKSEHIVPQQLQQLRIVKKQRQSSHVLKRTKTKKNSKRNLKGKDYQQKLAYFQNRIRQLTVKVDQACKKKAK